MSVDSALDDHLAAITSLDDPVVRDWTAYLMAGSDNSLRAPDRHVDRLQQALNRAATYWVTADMAELVASAADDMPDDSIDRTDILTDHGFARLGAPICWGEGKDEMAIDAISWQAAGELARVQQWTDFRRVGPHPLQDHFPGLARHHLRANWDSTVPLDRPWDDRDDQDLARLLRIIACLWWLTSQRVSRVVEDRPSRPVRRRAQRSGRPPGDCMVTTVDLRRVDYAQDDQPQGSQPVEWSHRWVVRGHWRRQWYPSEDRHKPVFVRPHVKGPEHLPLVAKDRVYRVVR